MLEFSFVREGLSTGPLSCPDMNIKWFTNKTTLTGNGRAPGRACPVAQ